MAEAAWKSYAARREAVEEQWWNWTKGKIENLEVKQFQQSKINQDHEQRIKDLEFVVAEQKGKEMQKELNKRMKQVSKSMKRSKTMKTMKSMTR